MSNLFYESYDEMAGLAFLGLLDKSTPKSGVHLRRYLWI